MQIENIAPMDIERESFATITRELGDRVLDPEQAPIIKRVIHTTADFEYADTLYFSPNVVERAKAAIRGGATIVTDTQMAWSGSFAMSTPTVMPLVLHWHFHSCSENLDTRWK